MPSDPFQDIDFTLPAAGRLPRAREIGLLCGEAWARTGSGSLPNELPAAVQGWSQRTRASWREGLVAGWEGHRGRPATGRADLPRGAGALVGYARVSTVDQSTDLQLDALTKAGCIRVFAESASGARRDRPELARALDYMRPGDTLVVWKLDRLARSLKQLVETVEALEAQGIGFRSLTESIDTTTPGGKLVFHIFAALAEFERGIIRERTRAGLDAARARGKVGGRPRALSDQDLQAAKALLTDPSITMEQAAKRLGVSVATLHRYLPGGRGELTATAP